jgi:hypothetical protein
VKDGTALALGAVGALAVAAAVRGRGRGSRVLARGQRAPRLWFLERPDDVRPPFEVASPAHPDLVNYRPYTALHLFMSPLTFLQLTSSLPATAETWSGHTDPWRYAAAMARGQGRFPLLFLDVAYNEVGVPFVYGHEGRHRALGAFRSGVPVVPVILYMHPEKRVEYAYEIDEYDPVPMIDVDGVAEAVTRGEPVTIRGQDFRRFPRDGGKPIVPQGLVAPAPIRVVPLDPAGQPLAAPVRPVPMPRRGSRALAPILATLEEDEGAGTALVRLPPRIWGRPTVPVEFFDATELFPDWETMGNIAGTREWAWRDGRDTYLLWVSRMPPTTYRLERHRPGERIVAVEVGARAEGPNRVLRLEDVLGTSWYDRTTREKAERMRKRLPGEP